MIAIFTDMLPLPPFRKWWRLRLPAKNLTTWAMIWNILNDIHSRVRQLLAGNEEDADLRMEMLIRIASRSEQLRHVAYNLDRPGV